MKLSVIILNYNVRYFLELCLKSVQSAITTIDAEIIVVDNKSSDDSCAMVKSLFPDVKLIQNNDNSGFSKGNNIGVALAKGQYLCILNPDTVVAEDTFIKLLEFSETKNNLGIVGCQLIDGKGTFLPESKRNIPTPKVSLKKMLGNSKDYYTNNLDENAIGKVDILVGAFMFMTKEVYKAVGGFDEDYFMYGEDIDLSYKVLKAGYTNYYYGDTSIIHFKGESTLRDTKYAKRFYGAMQIFYKKHFKRNLLFSSLVWLGIKLAYLLRTTDKLKMLKSDQSYVFSNTTIKEMVSQLDKPVHIMPQVLNKIAPNSTVVYDFNHLEIKAVIVDMKEKSKQQHIVFRLLPKNSNFIIGSDSAVNRGTIIHF
ncbi:glycosyltransferase family 2 protein [Winogradskyella sp.]|nr:glycosyltransferase family 2 protein [Winogradskyella sp.]MDC1505503.1 glycosyltransferase family 2 protein [Winogradskyella sp.]